MFAGTSDNVTGYAWSENIGWISFNCTNPGTCGTSNYGVTVDNSGLLSGYAWSEHIGWISFNAADTQNCPSPPCKAKLDKTAKKLEGWAKALVADGNGWDGWIHLSGTVSDGSPYGVTVSSCNYGGYAWGSDVVGWISFGGTNYGVVGSGGACVTGVSITGNGSEGTVTVAYGGNVNICWNSTQANNCTVGPPGWTGLSGCQTADNLTSNTTFTVTCNGPNGQVLNTIFVNVFIPPLSASCSAAPTSVKAGKTVTWSAITTGGIGSYTFGWHGDAPLRGKTGTPVYLSYDTTGTKSGSVTVTSGGNSLTVSCNNTVSVSAGIFEFIATSPRIVLGESSTLSWKSVGFTSCSMDQSIGSVGLTGTRTVRPSVTTTYTLTCTGSSDVKSVTVTVLQQPEFIEISPAGIAP